MTGRRWLVACAAASLLSVSPASLHSDDAVLLTVNRVQRVAPPAALVQQMDVLQELENVWLVRMPAGALPAVSRAGLAHHVLDPVPDGAALFLVSSARPEDVDLLQQAGAAWPIDVNTSLLATTDDLVRDRLPPHLRLNRLPDRLDRVPSFRIAGRPVAVARKAPLARSPGGTAIPELVAQVRTQPIADTIVKLESFKTRSAALPSCAAAGTWLFDSFWALGLDVRRDDFSFGTYNATNIVATLPGRTSPDRVVVVGAHYDSTSNDATRLAPGADDNASGTAVVLELARVLSTRQFDFTIEFVAFSAEEFGLYGSRHFAQDARVAGKRIIGVVNLDMVGYTNNTPEDLDLIVNARSEWLANVFADAAAAYAPLPTFKVPNPSLTYSDHAPFWDQNYSAVCGIEDYNPTNPNYHRTYDSFGTLNMTFVTGVARATLATVAVLAQPVSSPAPPSSVTIQTQLLGTLFMRARSAYLAWSAVPGATGYNVYRSAAPQGPYTRVNRTLLSGASYAERLLQVGAGYYYVVTSVDGSGRESNYSQEIQMGPQ